MAELLVAVKYEAFIVFHVKGKVCVRVLFPPYVCFKSDFLEWRNYWGFSPSSQSYPQHLIRLSKPAALCVASDDLLLCTDDGHRVVYQIQLERNGVTINGKLRKLIVYLEGIGVNCEIWFFSCLLRFVKTGPHFNSGLYCFTSEVTNMLENMTDNCRDQRK